MKKVLAVFAAAVLIVSPALTGMAAQSDTLTVKVTILSTLGVDIAETELDLGDVAIGETKASTSGVTVTNTGSGIEETYSLSLSNPIGWAASQTAVGDETYVLNAAFDADGTVAWDVDDHALSTTPVACSSTQFAGDQDGVEVPHNGERILYFEFHAPTSTSVTTEQGIVFTITAQAS